MTREECIAGLKRLGESKRLAYLIDFKDREVILFALRVLERLEEETLKSTISQFCYIDDFVEWQLFDNVNPSKIANAILEALTKEEE
jgi:hypothetical protein